MRNAAVAREATTKILGIETDPETRKLFRAACLVLGGTMHEHVNRFMRETIARAGLDGARAAR